MQTVLGVVAAMPQEIAPFLRRVGSFDKESAAGFNLFRFRLAGASVVLIESGMGPSHAAAATRKLIEIARPGVILNFGFAGGVAAGTGVGELVLAERVLLLEEGRLTEGPRPDKRLTALVADACQSAPLTLHRGTFVTAAGIMNKGAVADILGGEVAHPVLEMETAAVLLEAGLAGVPVVAVRGISDDAGEELEFTIEEFCDEELRISLARVLKCIAGKPWIIPQLLRLASNTRRTGRNLALCAELALQAFRGAAGA